jgi:putative FmdB family regulatory protein
VSEGKGVPIYDYGCSACGHVVEVIHGINDAGPRFCPNCGTEGTMRKAFATPAVHFKGSGWAKKDRAATAAPGKARRSETSSEPSETGAAAKPDSPAPAATKSADSGD